MYSKTLLLVSLHIKWFMTVTYLHSVYRVYSSLQIQHVTSCRHAPSTQCCLTIHVGEGINKAKDLSYSRNCASVPTFPSIVPQGRNAWMKDDEKWLMRFFCFFLRVKFNYTSCIRVLIIVRKSKIYKINYVPHRETRGKSSCVEFFFFIIIIIFVLVLQKEYRQRRRWKTWGNESWMAGGQTDRQTDKQADGKMRRGAGMFFLRHVQRSWMSWKSFECRVEWENKHTDCCLC